MSEERFTLFSTGIGHCGIAWNRRGITAVELPDGGQAAMRRALADRRTGAVETRPPPRVRATIDALKNLLAGGRPDLSTVPLCLDGMGPFRVRVYEITRRIPAGETRTYGEIARAMEQPGAARAVGVALGRNPFPLIVPCHRVLAVAGPGGFSAAGGVELKLRLLALEGASSPAAADLLAQP